MPALPNPLPTVSDAELRRAARVMRNAPEMTFPNARIVPRWREDATCLDYTLETPDGAQGRRLDLATGEVTAVALPAPPPPEREAALWAPDGQRAVVRREGNLWLIDAASGAERALTTDGTPHWGYGLPSDRWGQNRIARERAGEQVPPVQTWWSPDARFLVTARLDQRALAAYPYLEQAPADGSFRPIVHEVRLPLMGEPGATLDWWSIDIETGARTPIAFPTSRMIAANNGIDDLKVDWAADGRTMLAISGITGFVGAEAFAVDVRTGAVRVILEDRSGAGNPLVAGGYGRPVARFIRSGAELLWWSQRDGWGHLYRYDVATGAEIARVTAGEWLVRDVIGVDEARGEIWFTAMGREDGNPYHRYLYRVGFDGSGLALMTPEPGDHLIVDPTGSELVFDGAPPTPAVSPDFAHYAYTVSQVDAAPCTRVRRASDRAIVAELAVADLAGPIAAGYRPPAEFSALAADGRSMLHGLIYRPSDHDPAKRYPVIDVEYGNPAVAITPRSYVHAATFAGTAATPAALAELGFIVVVVDARGTPYRGRAFSHPPRDYLATMGLDDHIAFIRAAAAADPSLDLDRVGIAGQSFGGYTAVTGLLRFPDFFKVAVAGAPQLAYHNMAAEDILTCSRGAPVYADGSALRPEPDAVPTNFADLDLAQSLDQLQGKLLIVAGELDENVYPGTILQFVAKAQAEDRDVELVWMPGKAHDALFTRHALRRSLSFLLRHLQGRDLPAGPLPFPDPARGVTKVSY